MFAANIFKAYSKMFQKDVTPNPICALFGCTPEIHGLKGKAGVVIAFTSLIARRLILLSWKKDTPPTSPRWIRDIMHFLTLEKIRSTLKGSLQKFERAWTPFLEYYKSLQILLYEETSYYYAFNVLFYSLN